MKRAIIYLWGFVAVSSLTVGILFWNMPKADAYCAGDMNLSTNKPFKGPFTAINQNGQQVTQDDVIKGPSLLYFGYTFCPDICPLDTARNARVSEKLKAQNLEITPVFITVDPARDTAEVLKDFTHNFDKNMIGLTGAQEQIDALKKIYGAYGQKSEGETDPEYYMVDHSAFTYLVTPKGFVAAYDRALTEEQMSANILCHEKQGDLK